MKDSLSMLILLTTLATPVFAEQAATARLGLAADMSAVAASASLSQARVLAENAFAGGENLGAAPVVAAGASGYRSAMTPTLLSKPVRHERSNVPAFTRAAKDDTRGAGALILGGLAAPVIGAIAGALLGGAPGAVIGVIIGAAVGLVLLGMGISRALRHLFNP